MTYILGIETSCDETAVALVERDGRVAVNLIASQIDLHARYGGVVPEEAARVHIQACLPMVEEAFAAAHCGWNDIEAIAVTQGPGLIGCLLVGVETAKALAWAHDKPLIAANHLSGHLHAIFLSSPTTPHTLFERGESIEIDNQPLSADTRHPTPDTRVPAFPHAGLIVSGGHTSLVRVDAPGQSVTLAQTRDDAAGECYDKVARVAGLGYPGGPLIDQLAAQGNPAAFDFPVPMLRKDEIDFSFSGLKTAAGRAAEKLLAQHAGRIPHAVLCDWAAGVQHAITKVLIQKSVNASLDLDLGDLVITGGVASNKGLRARAREATRRQAGLRIWFPHPAFCTDNAAMIAGLAWHLHALEAPAARALNADAGLAFALAPR